MHYSVYICIYSSCMCIQMHVYMAAYGHKYVYMQHLGARKMRETSSQHIYTQETGVHYTKLTQLWCSAI